MKKSFTLIEIVVAVAIFAIAAALTIAISANVFQSRYKTENISNVQRNAQNIIQTLSKSIDNSNSCDRRYTLDGPIWYFGSALSSLPGDAISPAPINFGNDIRGDRPSNSLPFVASRKLTTISIDQFGFRHRKIFYLDNGNLMIDEVLNPSFDNLAFLPGSSGQIIRPINDNAVEITNMFFEALTIIDATGASNPCQAASFAPRAQNFLYVDLTIRSRVADPKGEYSLNVKKFIAQKNFRYKERW